MKKILILMLAGLGLAAAAFGTEQPSIAAGEALSQPSAAGSFSGTVVETMDSGGYTYVLVDTGKQEIWATAPKFAVKVGDAVMVPGGMPMENYVSKTLNREFALVYFVGAIKVAGSGDGPGKAGMPEGHPAVTEASGKPASDLAEIKVTKAGKTIQEIFAGKADLSGKAVQVRGKVVKFSPEIMGKNWLHLQDGTGAAGTNDLTVTTSSRVPVGATVLVNGMLSTDKDFGYGYKYDVILDDAQVVVE
jgi:hypothetical protein